MNDKYSIQVVAVSSKKKIALITGASSKFGQKLSEFLFEEGYSLILHFNQGINVMQDRMTYYHNKGYEFIVFKSDFAIPNTVKDAFERVCLKFGFPELVVNNAAYFDNDNFNNINLNRVNKHLNINMLSPLMLVSALVDYRNRGNGKEDMNIINVLDYCVSSIPRGNFVSYTLSKTSMLQLNNIMAVGLAPYFRVNSVAPGPFILDPSQDAAKYNHSSRHNLLGRSTTAEDVFSAISFLIKTRSITGEIIHIDGGKRLMQEEYF